MDYVCTSELFAKKLPEVVSGGWLRIGTGTRSDTANKTRVVILVVALSAINITLLYFGHTK